MGHRAKAYHVNLVLVPHYEVLGRQVGQVFESPWLLLGILAVVLKSHRDRVIEVNELFIFLEQL